MKRVGYLYEKIYDRDLLETALRMASRGKKKRRVVQRVLSDKDKHLDILQKILKDESYSPLGYTTKVLKEKGCSKSREINIPRFFPDQVVQWALILVIKPLLMRGMYDLSCASIDGRGSSLGIKFLKRWLSKDLKNTKYCLQTDIKKFYPSVNQDILLEKFAKIIKCKKTLSLIGKIVKSVDSGLPIGNVTSQWFANFYLQDFDHFAKEQLHLRYYIRYMDDMVFLSSNRRELFKQQKLMENFLSNEKLSLKPNWKIFQVGKDKSGRPIDFLGYKFYRDFINLRRKIFLRIKRRIKKIYKKKYLNVFDAQASISYMSRIKIASGNKIYRLFVKPYVDIGWCKKKVSLHDKKMAQKNNVLNAV